MKRTAAFWWMGVGLLFAAALLVPGQVQAKEQGGAYYKMQMEKLFKELNLSPAKAKEFTAVNKKYYQGRKELIDKLRKNETDLEKALAAPQPDEGKVKQLVALVVGGQQKLFQSFQAQRQAEMALLTPLQQGKYLMALRKWHREMITRHK
jgi:Spy/CpxP family protein refolding chaperone